MRLLLLLNPKQFPTSDGLIGWKKRPKSSGIPRYPEYENFEGKFLLPLKKKKKVEAVLDREWQKPQASSEVIAKAVIQAVDVLDNSYQSSLKQLESEPLPASFISLLEDMKAQQEEAPDPLWVISELIIHINTERKRRQDDEETLAFLLSIIH